jgi:hypothetical protein
MVVEDNFVCMRNAVYIGSEEDICYILCCFRGVGGGDTTYLIAQYGFVVKLKPNAEMQRWIRLFQLREKPNLSLDALFSVPLAVNAVGPTP